MAIVTKKFARKPFYVDAVRVTPENFLELSFWSQGSIRNNDESPITNGTTIDPANQHILVETNKGRNARQRQAHIGDWFVKSERGLRIYTHEAFLDTFGSVDPTSSELSAQGEEDVEPPADPDPTTDEPVETEAVPEQPPTETTPPAEPVPTPQA